MIQFLSGEDPYQERVTTTNDGWRQGDSPEEAQQLANQGFPTVVGWLNPDPDGIGHIAMVRPGEFTAEGPAIAQAGEHTKNRAHVHSDCAFSDRPVVYHFHD